MLSSYKILFEMINTSMTFSQNLINVMGNTGSTGKRHLGPRWRRGVESISD